VANQCVAAATRDDCTNGGGTVQENHVCGVSNDCDPTPGMQPITWWENCPTTTCGGQPLTDLDGLSGCVDSSADEIVDDLLCMQFPSGWCGSPSGAFLN
jgi:hypothetical protein